MLSHARRDVSALSLPLSGRFAFSDRNRVDYGRRRSGRFISDTQFRARHIADQILEFRPHVILIDEFINSQPGHRFCLKIKQSEKLRGIPVIILSTANNIELIVQECKANTYIKKPFDVQEMVEKVVSLIDNAPLEV